MINFDIVPQKYYSKKEQLNILERHIIIHSILYYELSENVIEDFQFDKLCKQMLKMSNEYQEDFLKTQYYYVFKDFDGCTGFYIYDRLNKKDKKYLTKIANHVLYLYKK